MCWTNQTSFSKSEREILITDITNSSIEANKYLVLLNYNEITNEFGKEDYWCFSLTNITLKEVKIHYDIDSR